MRFNVYLNIIYVIIIHCTHPTTNKWLTYFNTYIAQEVFDSDGKAIKNEASRARPQFPKTVWLSHDRRYQSFGFWRIKGELLYFSAVSRLFRRRVGTPHIFRHQKLRSKIHKISPLTILSALLLDPPLKEKNQKVFHSSKTNFSWNSPQPEKLKTVYILHFSRKISYIVLMRLIRSMIKPL